MNAKYRALNEALTRINDNLSSQGEALLPSPYKQEQADRIYDMMVQLIPIGAKVKVTWVPSAGNPSSFRVGKGVVTGHSAISIHEPSFHVELEDKSSVLLPGSLLEAV